MELHCSINITSHGSLQGKSGRERWEQAQAWRTQLLWREFFLDPSQWWDNRSTKQNPRFPDFKHKKSGEKALWMDNRFNPPWLHIGLDQGQAPQTSGNPVRVENFWQENFSDPSPCQDSRFIKEKLATMALDQMQSFEEWKTGMPNFCDADGDVSRLISQGRLEDALHMLELVAQQDIQVRINTYVCVLRECTRRKALVEGKRVHDIIVQKGLDSNMFLGNTLVNMYAKCGRLSDARQVFMTMPEQNVFSWTGIISAHANCKEGKEALDLFQKMQQKGIPANKVTFLVVLKACATIPAPEQGKQLHLEIIKSELASDVTLGNALIDMYAKCGCITDACRVFNNMNERNLVSWNAIMAGYTQLGLGKAVLAICKQMQQEGLQPNNVTHVILLKACASIAAQEQGKHLSLGTVKDDFADAYLGSSIGDTYLKCIEDARLALNTYNQDVVLWNATIAGYAQHGCCKEALELYEQMRQQHLQPDIVTYVVLLKACANSALLEEGKQLHVDIISSGFELDGILESSLVDMYAKCSCMESAHEVFKNMSDRDVVSWTTLIGGYARHGLGKEALALYEQMKQEGLQPDNVTYVVLLKACASIGALEQGKQLHSAIGTRALQSHAALGSALVDMYAKCGCMQDAQQVFNKIPGPDVVAWTARIAGYSKQGLGEEAAMLLEQMQREGVKPNEATYASVLSACSHSGLIDKASQVFNNMCNDRGVRPGIGHYACMVDLLCRAGCLAAAEDFINKMPIQPTTVIWMTLLAAARSHGQVEIGMHAFNSIVRLEPHNATAYVLLSNLCAAAGLNEKAVQMRCAQCKNEESA